MDDMNDISATLAAKSEQLTADDLVGGPITIKITGVSVSVGEDQPVKVRFEGDNGKPWMPCKNMRRILAKVWDKDGNQYIGRSVTLFRDPKVKFGALETGGVRISHMSHIDRAQVVAVQEKKGVMRGYNVQPLHMPEPAAAPAPAARTPPAAPSFVDKVRTRLAAAQGPDDVAAVANAAAVKNALQEAPEDVRRTLNEAIASAYARVDGTQDDAHSDFAET